MGPRRKGLLKQDGRKGTLDKLMKISPKPKQKHRIVSQASIFSDKLLVLGSCIFVGRS